MIAETWLVKLLLSHLLADFVLQPRSWIENRRLKHFRSPGLYLHGCIAGIAALLLIGFAYWPVAVVIWLSHTVIDGWKSYRKDTIGWFVADQALHLAVIIGCWAFIFIRMPDIGAAVDRLAANRAAWILVLGIVFLTTPAGIMIGQMTRSWREKIENAESLADAGKWIGVIERLIVLILILAGQYAAISILIGAKGIIRFNEKDRPEIKTEYLVIGTLISIGTAMIVGVAIKYLLQLAG